MEYHKMSACNIVMYGSIIAFFGCPLPTKSLIVEVNTSRYLVDLAEFLLIN
jgi:hypothetical protein